MTNIDRLTAVWAAKLTTDDAEKQGGDLFCATLAEIANGAVSRNYRAASALVKECLSVARRATGAEQWPTDEDMAGEILRRIEERKK